MSAVTSRRALLAVGVPVGLGVVTLVAFLCAGKDDPVQKLQAEDASERYTAVDQLIPMKSKPWAAQAIARATRDKDVRVACRAVEAIGIGHRPYKPLPKESVQVLADAMKDQRPDVRAAAASVLGETTPIAPDDPDVPERLLNVFRTDPSPDVRAAAAQALGELYYWPAMETLVAAMEDQSVMVRGSAGAAVQKMLGVDYRFRAEDPIEKRTAALQRIRAGWRSQAGFHSHYVNTLKQKMAAKAEGRKP